MPTTRPGWVLAKRRTISPPVEWPASTSGPRMPAARIRARRSATVSAAVRGMRTGSLRLNASAPRVVPGRSRMHARVKRATPVATAVPVVSSGGHPEVAAAAQAGLEDHGRAAATVALDVHLAAVADTDEPREVAGAEAHGPSVLGLRRGRCEREQGDEGQASGEEAAGGGHGMAFSGLVTALSVAQVTARPRAGGYSTPSPGAEGTRIAPRTGRGPSISPSKTSRVASPCAGVGPPADRPAAAWTAAAIPAGPS